MSHCNDCFYVSLFMVHCLYLRYVSYCARYVSYKIGARLASAAISGIFHSHLTLLQLELGTPLQMMRMRIL